MRSKSTAPTQRAQPDSADFLASAIGDWYSIDPKARNDIHQLADFLYSLPPVNPVRERGEENEGSSGSETDLERSSVSNSHLSPSFSVVVAPGRSPRALDFELLGQWEGTVSDVRSDEFIATLRDLRDPDDPTRQEVAFDIEDVVNGDLHLLKEGAVFTWTIGREMSPWGQIKNVDFIRFLRLPAWSRKEVELAERRAEELKALFGSEE